MKNDQNDPELDPDADDVESDDDVEIVEPEEPEEPEVHPIDEDDVRDDDVEDVADDDSESASDGDVEIYYTGNAVDIGANSDDGENIAPVSQVGYVRFDALTIDYPGWTNPRSFTGLDDASMADLAASIKHHTVQNEAGVTYVGIKEPLRVLHIMRNGLVDLLVVDGQRRYRATKIAVPIPRRWFPSSRASQNPSYGPMRSRASTCSRRWIAWARALGSPAMSSRRAPSACATAGTPTRASRTRSPRSRPRSAVPSRGCRKS